jgi:hypothetical protein
MRAVIVVPRLKCGQAECFGEDTGNRVNSVQNDRGRGDGREPRHNVAGEYYQISPWKWGVGND